LIGLVIGLGVGNLTRRRLPAPAAVDMSA
jgi:hypothetical protein